MDSAIATPEIPLPLPATMTSAPRTLAWLSTAPPPASSWTRKRSFIREMRKGINYDQRIECRPCGTIVSLDDAIHRRS